MLSSPFAQVDWLPLPQELAERTREWRDATFHRTLRMIMEGYGSRKRSLASGARRGRAEGGEGSE